MTTFSDPIVLAETLPHMTRRLGRVKALLETRADLPATPRFASGDRVACGPFGHPGRVQIMRRAFVAKSDDRKADTDESPAVLIYEGESFARDPYGIYMVKMGARGAIRFWHESEMVDADQPPPSSP